MHAAMHASMGGMPWPAAARSVPCGRVPVCRSAASGWALRSLDRLLQTQGSTAGSHGVRCAAYAGFQGGPAAAAGRALLPPLPYGLRSVLKQQQVTPTGASGCRELPPASPPTPVSHTVPHSPPVAVTGKIARRRWWASGSAWQQRRRLRRSWQLRQSEPRGRQQQRPPWATSRPSTLATVGGP